MCSQHYRNFIRALFYTVFYCRLFVNSFSYFLSDLVYLHLYINPLTKWKIWISCICREINKSLLCSLNFLFRYCIIHLEHADRLIRKFGFYVQDV